MITAFEAKIKNLVSGFAFEICSFILNLLPYSVEFLDPRLRFFAAVEPEEEWHC